tara:strand:+ start:76 stop:669 length:594 start_codon:yes stop_codon:yes gene_type:complete
MLKLTTAINTLLCLYEDSNIKISLLSFLVLDYHVSTSMHDIRHPALGKVYGISDEQLDLCYLELEYYGYIQIKNEFIAFTKKAKETLNVVGKRMTTQERLHLESTFETFWKSYPIKVGKKKAMFEWKRLRPDDKLIAKIMLSINAQLEYKVREERKGSFVPRLPDAERWIKHERYNDEFVAGKNYISINNKTQRDER